MKNDMTTPLPEETPEAAPDRRRKNVFRLLLLPLLFLFLLLAGGAVLTAFLLFSPPKKLPLEPLTKEDLLLQQRLLRRLSRESFRRKAKNKEAVLVLSPAEIKSLVRLIDYGFAAARLAGRYTGPELRYFEPDFGKGRLRAVYPLNTGYRWLFGGVLRWEITATPHWENNKLTAVVHNCRIGRIPLPRSVAQKLMHRLLAGVHRSREYGVFCKVIRKLYIKKDGSLAVVYSPRRLLRSLTI